MLVADIYPLGHLLLGIAELFLIAWSIRLWQKSNSLAMGILPIILLSTAYDNVVLACGQWIGEGTLLQSLNDIRFLLHYLVVPFFIVVAVELASRAGAGWVIPLTRGLGWVLAIGLGILDYLNHYLNLSLVPTEFAGVLRYAQASPNLPIVTITINVFLLIISIGIWVRLEGKWPWLLVGTVVAFLGNAIPISEVGTLPGSTSEFILGLTLLLTERYLQQNAPDLDLDRDIKFEFIPLHFNWVAIHPQPKGVIYFIGGAGFGTFPTVFYHYLLRRLFQEGYTIIALPFRFTFNHWSVAIQMVKDQEQLLTSIRQEAENRNYTENLELYSNEARIKDGNHYWLGHSLGCKYIALLEILSELDRKKIQTLLGNCVKNHRQVHDLEVALAKTNLENLSLKNQPSMMMAPIITGIEGAIPIQAIAKFVKNIIDVRPSKEQTYCLIKNGQLFHFISLIGFQSDQVQAKAKTLSWLEKNLPQTPFEPIVEKLPGGHLSPLNLLKRNAKLADTVVDLLPKLHYRIK